MFGLERESGLANPAEALLLHADAVGGGRQERHGVAAVSGGFHLARRLIEDPADPANGARRSAPGRYPGGHALNPDQAAWRAPHSKNKPARKICQLN